MDEPENKELLPAPAQSEDAYLSIRGFVIDAQRQVYGAVNAAMVTAYWRIGRTIHAVCGENGRAAYGKRALDRIARRLTAEFGKGFSVRNLRNMRRFYLLFPIRQTLSAELSWSHYQLLMRAGGRRGGTPLLRGGGGPVRMERQAVGTAGIWITCPPWRN